MSYLYIYIYILYTNIIFIKLKNQACFVVRKVGVLLYDECDLIE